MAGLLPGQRDRIRALWQAESCSEVCELPRAEGQASRLKENGDGNNLGSLKSLSRYNGEVATTRMNVEF